MWIHRNIKIVVMAGILCLAGWQIAHILLEYRAGEETYARLVQVSRQKDDSVQAAPDDSTRNFAALQEINGDILAWISVPDTGIDYPVVQGTDNDYYLRRLVTKEWNSSGSIFLDYRSAPDLSDPYSIIYGHNMLNGTMFSSLMEYKNQDFYQTHPKGTLETPNMQYEILFFAGFVANVDHPVWNIDLSGEELPVWAAEMQRLSYFQSGVLPDAEDTVIALATCSYEFNNARFVLLGILQPQSGG